MTKKDICLFCFNVVISGAIAGISGPMLPPLFHKHEWLFAVCGVVGYVATLSGEFVVMLIKEHYNKGK